MSEARSSSSPVPVVPVAGIVVGVVLVILGQFVLDKMADTSEAWHYIQHGVLFVAGLAIGAAIVALYQAGQRRV